MWSFPRLPSAVTLLIKEPRWLLVAAGDSVNGQSVNGSAVNGFRSGPPLSHASCYVACVYIGDLSRAQSDERRRWRATSFPLVRPVSRASLSGSRRDPALLLPHRAAYASQERGSKVSVGVPTCVLLRAKRGRPAPRGLPVLFSLMGLATGRRPSCSWRARNAVRLTAFCSISIVSCTLHRSALSSTRVPVSFSPTHLP